MKNRILYITLGLALVFSACNDFIKEDSGDLLIPKALAEFTPLLYGEAYPKDINSDLGYYALMTDDVEVNELEYDPYLGSKQPGFDPDGGDGWAAFTWSAEIENYLPDANWKSRYKNILGCNTIIDALPDMIYNDSEVGQYHNLAAQAYALRAYNYFVLINCYALPWSTENLDKPGVIIRQTPGIIVGNTPRSTIGQVYELINGDIEKAIKHMEQAMPSTSMHLITPAALSFLVTRIALFQEDWGTVIGTGEKLLAAYPRGIKDLNTVSENWMGQYEEIDEYKSGFVIMNAGENPEIIFTFGNSSSSYDYLAPGSNSYDVGFRVSYSYEGSLFESYDDDDLRKLAYFARDFHYVNPRWGIEYYEYKYHRPYKYPSSASLYNITYTNYHENWRTVEVLLNVAEAYARRDGKSNKAIELLNTLRRNRIRTDAFVELTASDFATAEDLVRFIWDERRRELCFEEAMRFWDLRRQGMPQIEHKLYSNTVSYETYVLPQGSSNYVMPIPSSEYLYNGGVRQNERSVILPQ